MILPEAEDDSYVERCAHCGERAEQPVHFRGFVFCSKECKIAHVPA